VFLRYSGRYSDQQEIYFIGPNPESVYLLLVGFAQKVEIE